MKVLEPSKPKVYVCTGNGNGGSGCEAKLEVERSDLFQTSRTCYGDTYPEYFATFRCPLCKTLTDVKGFSRPETLPRDPEKVGSNNDPLG